MELYLSGMVTAGFLVAGLFFAKFWSRSRDLLFAAFAAAFWLMATNQLLLAIGNVPREEKSWTFLLRLAAFTLIAVAIIHKNARRRSD
jgi:zinc transporter ZupT